VNEKNGGELEVGLVVAAFIPQGRRARAAWPYTHRVVAEAVRASTRSPRNGAKYLSHLSDFAAWAHEQGAPLTLKTLLDADVIERYIAVGMSGSKDSTRATRRAILRRVARHCASPPQDLPLPIAYRRVRPPYSPEEIRGLLALASAQPTPSRRRTLRAILHLGLGCGIASRDLAWVRGQDVELLTDGAVSVTVSGGTRPRSVITLQAHETALLEIAWSARSGLLIGGTTRGRRNVTRGPLERVVGGEDLPRLETARLRSTWLLAHLRARTPLPVLMNAAGLTTVRPLEDLLHHCPVDADAARVALRTAG
jgi:hypothetical protein